LSYSHRHLDYTTARFADVRDSRPYGASQFQIASPTTT